MVSSQFSHGRRYNSRRSEFATPGFTHDYTYQFFEFHTKIPLMRNKLTILFYDGLLSVFVALGNLLILIFQNAHFETEMCFICLIKWISGEYVQLKPKQFLWPITKDDVHLTNQSKLKLNICSWPEARENLSESQLVFVLFLIRWEIGAIFFPMVFETSHKIG